DGEHAGAPGGGGGSARARARSRPAAAQDAREDALTRAAVLAPGYGGTAEQGIVRALARALARFDIATSAITFRTSGKRPSRGYVSELEDLRAAREALRAEHDRVALVGRSFGGRMCAFLA